MRITTPMTSARDVGNIYLEAGEGLEIVDGDGRAIIGVYRTRFPELRTIVIRTKIGKDETLERVMPRRKAGQA